MTKFRYDTTGKWYKGNTHIHSQASDGGKTFAELARMYSGRGYDFLFRTDHWVAGDVANDVEKYPLLWLDGIEINGTDDQGGNYHAVCLGSFKSLDCSAGFVTALQAVRAQGGLTVLAHPFWMGNTLADALRWKFDGVEVYNHVCRWLNGKGDGAVHWDAMLKDNPATLSFAADDAHITDAHPGWDGGWIMVNIPKLGHKGRQSRKKIMSAIRAGNFYSTTGPQIHSIEYDALTTIHIKTSPVQFIRLVGPGSQGRRIGTFDDNTITEATFEIPPDWPYAYIEIEDPAGKRAWTNTLFI